MKILKLNVSFSFYCFTDHEILVYTSNNPYSPLLAYKNPKPLKFNFIGFASAHRMQYFYDVNEDLLLQSKPAQTLMITETKPMRHPFLYQLNLKPENENICKFSVFLCIFFFAGKNENSMSKLLLFHFIQTSHNISKFTKQ